LKYKFLNYKPTQKEHVSCVILEKGLLPWHLGSFDYVFTLGGIKPKCKVKKYIFLHMKWEAFGNCKETSLKLWGKFPTLGVKIPYMKIKTPCESKMFKRQFVGLNHLQIE
jgi:hypothetical protein